VCCDPFAPLKFFVVCKKSHRKIIFFRKNYYFEKNFNSQIFETEKQIIFSKLFSENTYSKKKFHNEFFFFTATNSVNDVFFPLKFAK